MIPAADITVENTMPHKRLKPPLAETLAISAIFKTKTPLNPKP